ncbi:uncharacterized protein B0J16DRAFT_340882 [Fusarium flagelliforme]|uniref:uncharacterized protein n=1 Tax=Fusarium flagelliforme TaxID=2675880 RepID=UPI001E8DD47C|nr:uncharacterized protein B0J16DRAFT_340882 [Fusarium flagelliforme]KAH7185101.1 hypothetical protein B0J16DRAFT_340882 [Fusarium flagelliforme]
MRYALFFWAAASLQNWSCASMAANLASDKVPNSISSTLSIPPFILPVSDLNLNVSPDFGVTDTVRMALWPGSVDCARLDIGFSDVCCFILFDDWLVVSSALRFLPLVVEVSGVTPRSFPSKFPPGQRYRK